MKTRRLLLVEALESAGRILCQAQGKASELGTKGHQDAIVTEADLEAEHCIISLILGAYPDHGVVSEELGKLNHEADYIWVIDPLDGTSNFAAGIPLFGVSICVVHQGVPVIGGTFLPRFEELFLAELGRGATLNNHPIRVTTETSLRKVLVGYPIDANNEREKLDVELKLAGKLINAVRSLRMFNASTVELSYLACGRLGGVLTKRCRTWDVATGYLLVREAGGVVTDFEGNDLRFDRFDEYFEFIAANVPLHKAIAAMAKVQL